MSDGRSSRAWSDWWWRRSSWERGSGVVDVLERENDGVRELERENDGVNGLARENGVGSGSGKGSGVESELVKGTDGAGSESVGVEKAPVVF